MRRTLMLSGLALAAMARPAAAFWVQRADGSYQHVPAGRILVIVIVVSVGVGLFALLANSMISPPPRRPPPREKTADEYNAEAVLLAAKRNHMEMQTELRKAEIEAARMEAIHKERGEIIAHDRKVRDLNAKLDEKRRAS